MEPLRHESCSSPSARASLGAASHPGPRCDQSGWTDGHAKREDGAPPAQAPAHGMPAVSLGDTGTSHPCSG